MFFHGIELMILLFFLSFIFKPLFFIFIGASFHLLLDLVYQTTYSERIDRFSLIFDFFKYRNLDFILPNTPRSCLRELH